MSMPFARRLARKHPDHFLFSILLLDVIPTLVSLARERSSPGKLKKSYPDVTDAFLYLQDYPYHQIDKDDSHFKMLERFTVVLYDKTSNAFTVNEACKEMFTKKNRILENIPPTQVS